MKVSRYADTKKGCFYLNNLHIRFEVQIFLNEFFNGFLLEEHLISFQNENDIFPGERSSSPKKKKMKKRTVKMRERFFCAVPRKKKR